MGDEPVLAGQAGIAVAAVDRDHAEQLHTTCLDDDTPGAVAWAETPARIDLVDPPHRSCVSQEARMADLASDQRMGRHCQLNTTWTGASAACIAGADQLLAAAAAGTDGRLDAVAAARHTSLAWHAAGDDILATAAVAVGRSLPQMLESAGEVGHTNR